MDKKEKKDKPWAKLKIKEIDPGIKEAMGNFFGEFLSVGGLLSLIMLAVFLKILEFLGLVKINLPFL